MGAMKLVDCGAAAALETVRAQGAGTRVRVAEGGKRLRVEFPPRADGRASFRGPAGGWDLSGFVSIELEVTNAGEAPVALRGWLDDKEWVDALVVLRPGETDTLGIVMRRTKSFPGMNGLPGGHVTLWEEADPARISAISIAPIDAAGPSAVEVASVCAVGEYAAPPAGGVAEELLPLVDRYGQFRHSDWPGKMHSDVDLSAERAREESDLAAHPGPDDWNRYGGWAAGPRLEATGHFRVAKHADKWWLVDPEGRLFWSHGIDCVWPGERTRVEGREGLFEELDDRFREGANYDILSRGRHLRYGDDWEAISVDLAHRRLRSWGMNTIGNWSREPVYEARRTPYVVGIHYDLHAEFPYSDMEAFRQALRGHFALEQGNTAADPWCIGYFIDNELRWPAGDCSESAEEYYRICLEETRRAAPDKLYLGSRLHEAMSPFGGAEEVVRAAARHCDVVSVNRYRLSPSDLRMPEGVDKPLIIGEWHFGALDRGMLHPGLRSAANQRQRGASYRHYLRQAVVHPHIVGAHWFQYGDQPLTGRDDGENYQVGFVDVCDNPYPETIAACREVGYEVYRLRR